jgi:hypothetical protein
METKSLDVWQFRVRTLGRLVRGWAPSEVAALNNESASDDFGELNDTMIKELIIYLIEHMSRN